MTQDLDNSFNGASKASGRAMWRRQVANLQSKDWCHNHGDAAMAQISLPSGEQIHDISKLYQKHCLKDEQRSAHRVSQKKARAVCLTKSERQPFDPKYLLARRLTNVPDVVYKTDCGPNKSLQRHVQDGSNICRSAFSSTKDRFASTAAYRSSTFASIVKEPYADPQAVGPGTYRAPRRAICIKKKQIPTPAYVSKVFRFQGDNAQVSTVLDLVSPITNLANEQNCSLDFSRRGAGSGDRSSPNKARGLVLSTTPRFKSDVFPERYSSSKQHCVQDDAPDRFYDVSPSCKEAAMVHNTPNFPILTSATQDTVGPGSYSPAFQVKPPEDANFIMMPHTMNRFGLPNATSGFIEARFRRFAAGPDIQTSRN